MCVDKYYFFIINIRCKYMKCMNIKGNNKGDNASLLTPVLSLQNTGRVDPSAQKM